MGNAVSIGKVLGNLQIEKVHPRYKKRRFVETLDEVDRAILKILISLHANKHYVIVPHTVIQDLLARYYKIFRSIRTIVTHMNKLYELGYIDRRRRTQRDKAGRIRNLPNLYILRKKALRFFRGMIKFVRRVKEKIRRIFDNYCFEDKDLCEFLQMPCLNSPSCPLSLLNTS